MSYSGHLNRIEDALRDAAALKGHDNPEKIALIELAHYIKHGPEED